MKQFIRAIRIKAISNRIQIEKKKKQKNGTETANFAQVKVTMEFWNLDKVSIFSGLHYVVLFAFIIFFLFIHLL